MDGKRVIICAGGTGGHLYPALAVGAGLRSLEPDIRILYVGSHRKVEKKIMEQHGVDFVPIKVEGLKRRGLRKFPALFMLIGAFRRSHQLLLEFKPHLVIGAGGYSSGPLVLLASRRKIPTVILEQNAVPGFTNRLLARRVDRAVVAFPATAAAFGDKAVYLGNPVRQEFENLPAKAEKEGLDLLILGGSQGSRFLNERVTACLPLISSERAGLRIVHQTGDKDYDWVKKRYQEEGFAADDVLPYLNDMPARFAAADLIISRAGAMTCAEIIAAGKAAVLVPFAGAVDDHQTKNALQLQNVSGAELIPEAEASAERLAARISHFLKNKSELSSMANNLNVLRTEKAAEKIAKLSLSLIPEDKEQEKP